jgi:hypothetical protein
MRPAGFEPAMPASEPLNAAKKIGCCYLPWNTFLVNEGSEPNVISAVNMIRVLEVLGLKLGLKAWYRNVVVLGFL